MCANDGPQAAQRAELSALEVQQQSETDTTAGGNGVTSASLHKPSSSARTSTSSQANRWGLWTLCWQLGRIVLNRLQLTVNDVHLTFRVSRWHVQLLCSHVDADLPHAR